jgi:hypothetical protein
MPGMFLARRQFRQSAFCVKAPLILTFVSGIFANTPESHPVAAPVGGIFPFVTIIASSNINYKNNTKSVHIMSNLSPLTIFPENLFSGFRRDDWQQPRSANPCRKAAHYCCTAYMVLTHSHAPTGG